MRCLILDVETTTSNKGNPHDETNKLCYVGLYDGTTKYLVDIEYSDEPYLGKLDLIRDIIARSDCIVGFNLKFDTQWLRKFDVDVSALDLWDCQLFEFLKSNQKDRMPSLDEVLIKRGMPGKTDVVKTEYWDKGIDTTEIPRDILEAYLSNDLEVTWKLLQEQLRELSTERLRLFRLQCLDLKVLAEMEWNGLKYDSEASLAEAERQEKELGQLRAEMDAIIDYAGLNWNSTDQLSAVLYGGNVDVDYRVPDGFYKSGAKAGLPKLKWATRTITFPRLVKPNDKDALAKPNLWSTSEDSLLDLKATGKAKRLITLVLKYSKLEKLISTYLRGLPKKIEQFHWKDNIIHGQLNQTVVVTGRLSASNPNQQNLDPRAEEYIVTRFN